MLQPTKNCSFSPTKQSARINRDRDRGQRLLIYSDEPAVPLIIGENERVVHDVSRHRMERHDCDRCDFFRRFSVLFKSGQAVQCATWRQKALNLYQRQRASRWARQDNHRHC